MNAKAFTGAKPTSIASIAVLIALLILSGQVPIAGAVPPAPALLDPTTIPKYENQLDGPPPVYVPRVLGGKGPNRRYAYAVFMLRFDQQILPTGYPPTTVWGYGGLARDAVTGENLGFVASSPGPTFEAERGIPAYVSWQNLIGSEHMFAVDPTLHWADPNDFGMPVPPYLPYPPGYPEAQWPVPLIPHLHGGEIQSTSDGHPEAWFTASGIRGPAYNTEIGTTPWGAVFYYPNEQPPTTMWYHDHALGITRLNVMSGLAGFYLLGDPADDIADDLPNGQYEMPIVIQDRIFQTDGSMYFPSEGNSPSDHPYWNPEFFGDTIMVNGKVWPNMNVDQGQYRLRLLDGSNARFYTLKFQVKTGEQPDGAPIYGATIPFTQIGSDGGYLKSAVQLDELTIAPGERADILVDFTGLDPETQVILTNIAVAPFKGPGGTGGEPANPLTVGQIMQFTVTYNDGFEPQTLPDPLNDLPTLADPDVTRILTLIEVMSPEDEPVMILLDGQKWGAPISENVNLGTTEDWIIVNPTEDTHPIHLHLVQFQLVYRQDLENATKYLEDWIVENGEPPLEVPTTWPTGYTELEDYLTGTAEGPPMNEQGWKDTIQAHPGQITVIRVRFAPIDGSDNYPFDATEGPGYVWHCHILDHEDNEMMRPYIVIAAEESS